MRTEERTVYHCDYCKKYTLQKSSILRHERACKKNPDIMLRCRGCSFCTVLETEDFTKDVDYISTLLKKAEYDRFFPNAGGEKEIIISFSFHYCQKLEKKMMPPKAFNGYYGIVLNETENAIKMPTVNEGCSYFKCRSEEEYEY